MLHSDLPPHEKTPERLFQEAQVIVGGGILTTSWALTIAGFHIADKPHVFQKLRAELLQAIPDLMAPLDFLKLEKLPYLTACIREGIRLAYGITSRMPRLAHKSLQYKEWTIPARTPVSMTIVDVNHDEEVFPDSRNFVPERWLGNPKTTRGDSLERYFIGFGRGTRSCIGLK
jgi:cytochrome P450